MTERTADSGLRRLPRRDLLSLAVLALGAVVLLTLPHERQLAVATLIRSTVLAPVLSLRAGLAEASSSRTQLQELRAERDALLERVLELQGVEEEVVRLRGLLGLSGRGSARARPANLYPAGRAGEGVQRSFVLDVGIDQGVIENAAVVAPQGLVGVVRVAIGSQSAGDFWTHSEFRVSAMTADGAVYGIVRPLPGAPPRIELAGAPYQQELDPGVELVTSGLGGVFPRGVPIGRIVEPFGAEAGWARSYLVEPAVHPAAVREVMVLLDAGDAAADVSELWDRTLRPERRR